MISLTATIKPKTDGFQHILIVDDNRLIQRTLFFILRDSGGYKPQLAGDIATAMQLIRAEKPDLIILDLHFPMEQDMMSGVLTDGMWALNWIRQQAALETTPVIVISADAPEIAKAEAMHAGAAAYLQKPIDKGVLLQTVKELLSYAQLK
jgi:CheY-like chemotaxis protein